ncbi:hypothetical protein CBR_g19448 [Chara braunii]|uniref:ubiquitinyl hydrolase 1 n=1 Tax=Chara braunii TaxID=69332 RepID=A0A388KY01_CHABU|nr:hypothetical protein CBR_g19448 [Chara braunii]|eukprot:GBG74934.1 hypothetical protein CBR_g19448 [Chara braunii]
MEGFQPSQSVSFRWVIENFTKLTVRKLYSHTFAAGGHSWRLLLFPKGNSYESVQKLAVYVDVPYSEWLEVGWSRNADFTLRAVNQRDPSLSIENSSSHKFHKGEADWGFREFMPLKDLVDPSKGFLVDGTVVIEAEVSVGGDVVKAQNDSRNAQVDDSRKATGFVALRSKYTAASSFMNAVLQTLYHLPYLRKAVYHMSMTECEKKVASTTAMPFALQCLFHKMQNSDASVQTDDFATSSDWDSWAATSFCLPYEGRKFLLIIFEQLERAMRWTGVAGTIQDLFQGHYVLSSCADFVDDVAVKEKRRRISFYDLELDVRGCKDVYESFDKYCSAGERLEGGGKRRRHPRPGGGNGAGVGEGRRKGNRRIWFETFPTVLCLHLKRFEYDVEHDNMVKVNDRYEFPVQLDLDRDGGKYLASDRDRSVRNLYTLYSVLAHSGGINNGRCQVFIRPMLLEQWYKSDDEGVRKEDARRAVEEQYGGEEEMVTTPKTTSSNAYVLVYVREEDKGKVMCKVDDTTRIAKRCQSGGGVQQKVADWYAIVKVAREEDFREQIGWDILFDLVDFEKVGWFVIGSHSSFQTVKDQCAAIFHIPIQCQRFWLWEKRKNHTYRLSRPLTPDEEMQIVKRLIDERASTRGPNAGINLFLEKVPENPEGVSGPIHNRPTGKDDILIFFKKYSPAAAASGEEEEEEEEGEEEEEEEEEELRYVGKMLVKGETKPCDVMVQIKQLGVFKPNEEVILYEEIKFDPTVMCIPIDKTATFSSSGLEDGDIVCVQRAIAETDIIKYRYPDVPSYLDYVRNRQVVRFHRLSEPNSTPHFVLEMSRQHTYDDVVQRVARHVGVDDPGKIHLTAHNCFSQAPRSRPIKHEGGESLADMLAHHNRMSEILYYDVVNPRALELERWKTLEVRFYNSRVEEVCVRNIRLPKESTVGELIKETSDLVDLSNSASQLRILEVSESKIRKIFLPTEKLDNISNHTGQILRAEEIPEEEKDLGNAEEGRLIHVCHVWQDSAAGSRGAQTFGEPFCLAVREKETLVIVKTRIKRKLAVPYDDFSKWKFACMERSAPLYLQDTDIVLSCFGKRTQTDDDCEQYLGLEHADTAHRMSHRCDGPN